MWAVVGVLLGCMLIALLAGFHMGPHSHAAAAVLGLVVAVLLIIMAFSRLSAPVLWVIFGCDVALSGGVAVLAWKGLQSRHTPSMPAPNRLEGASGVAESALVPDGLVKIHGETWSATSLNGNLPAGAHVQVIREGVRLGVWGEDVDISSP
ncbi:MAG: NfeD family protein [Acidimicrobiales bacterium]